MSTATMTRREWIDATKRRLDELDTALTRLESQASSARDDVSDDLEAKMQATRKGLSAAQERWASVRNSSSEAWDSVSEEIGEAWETNKTALSRSIDEIRSAMDRVTA